MCGAREQMLQAHRLLLSPGSQLHLRRQAAWWLRRRAAALQQLGLQRQGERQWRLEGHRTLTLGLESGGTRGQVLKQGPRVAAKGQAAGHCPSDAGRVRFLNPTAADKGLMFLSHRGGNRIRRAVPGRRRGCSWKGACGGSRESREVSGRGSSHCVQKSTPRQG